MKIKRHTGEWYVVAVREVSTDTWVAGALFSTRHLAAGFIELEQRRTLEDRVRGDWAPLREYRILDEQEIAEAEEA